MFLRSLLFVLFLGACHPAFAADSVFVPQFFDTRDRVLEPEAGSLRPIRFLTEDDYPPFSSVMPDGQLTGFNVELARLICERLKVPCTIQPRRWDTLLTALNKDRSGDALIASLAINARSRAELEFSRAYLRMPARFVARAGQSWEPLNAAALTDKRIGVLPRSAHGAFVRDVFPAAKPLEFDDLGALRKALNDGSIDLIFADGVTNAIWLAGEEGACCRFVGGPYLESRYFGEGVGIGFRKDREGIALRQAVDYALNRLAIEGKLGDLYLKYFPVGFF